MVFVASIISHKLYIIFFYYFFRSNIIFDPKSFSFCWDKFDYPGSIVYLSCLGLYSSSWLSYSQQAARVKWISHCMHISFSLIVFSHFSKFWRTPLNPAIDQTISNKREKLHVLRMLLKSIIIVTVIFVCDLLVFSFLHFPFYGLCPI